jgi:hypothetical protein
MSASIFDAAGCVAVFRKTITAQRVRRIDGEVEPQDLIELSVER